MKGSRYFTVILIAVFTISLFGGLTIAKADVPPEVACEARTNNTAEKLLECVTLEGVREHQAALQAIADANGGVRTSGTSGYDASVQYVVDTMTAAGYDVTVQEFPFNFFIETAPPVFRQVSPNPTTYVDQVDFAVMTFSGSGDLTNTTVTPVDLSLADPAASTSGCEASDYAGFPAGHIALVQRGTCTFFLKASNAEAAGASGVIVFNQGTPEREGLFFGTLGTPGVNIPVISISFTLGQELAGGATVDLFVSTISEVRLTSNVLAETSGGRADNIVMAGAHLDSVTAGPGIQDNGSGSSVLLEIAEQMKKVQPRNKVRFAWWGAEEFGLVGSLFYVNSLSEDELNNIALYLNFDMVGSPNFVRFVYDGDSSDTTGENPQPGSGIIEKLFLDYFESQGLPTRPTEIGNRSDHAGFRNAGIPIGGLFTGAEGIKTPEEVAVFGGTAGEQYDPCYHLACDTFENVSLEALDQNSDAAAFAILTYGMNTESINGIKGKGNFKPQDDDFLEPMLIK